MNRVHPIRRPAIGVIGSGTLPYPEFSRPLGRWLAEQGYDLINGGGGGTMEEAARAFSEVRGRPGQVIGILPSARPCTTREERNAYQTPGGYPNPFTDRPIYTHLHLSGPAGKATASRNHIMVLSADLLVALPGSEGTHSEIQLALEYQKPLALLNRDGVWNEFIT